MQSILTSSHVHVTRGRRPPKKNHRLFSLAQDRSSGLAGHGVGHKVTAAPAAVTSRLESAPKPLASPFCNPLDRYSLSFPADLAKTHPIHNQFNNINQNTKIKKHRLL